MGPPNMNWLFGHVVPRWYQLSIQFLYTCRTSGSAGMMKRVASSRSLISQLWGVTGCVVRVDVCGSSQGVPTVALTKKMVSTIAPMALVANTVWKSTTCPQKKSCHQLCPLGRPGHPRVLTVGKMMVIMAYRVATWIQSVPQFLVHAKTYLTSVGTLYMSFKNSIYNIKQ
jgi:hypothetical protein